MSEKTIDDAIRAMIREEVGKAIASTPVPDPELISVDEAAKAFGCSRSVISELVKERAVNGFPAVILGERTIRIDKRRLNLWLQNGGLTALDSNKGFE